MHLDHLPIGSDPPNEVNAVIEVPVGGEPIKYETDTEARDHERRHPGR